MNKGELAAQYFLKGYNCAQAVAVAYAEELGLSEQQAARAVSGFGGGVARQREVCGAVSGMVFVYSSLRGYDDPADDAGKKAMYGRIQQLCEAFRSENGSIVCRELLKNPPNDPNPTPRTAEFYRQRPCARMVYTAARLLEEALNG